MRILTLTEGNELADALTAPFSIPIKESVDVEGTPLWVYDPKVAQENILDPNVVPMIDVSMETLKPGETDEQFRYRKGAMVKRQLDLLWLVLAAAQRPYSEKRGDYGGLIYIEKRMEYSGKVGYGMAPFRIGKDWMSKPTAQEFLGSVVIHITDDHSEDLFMNLTRFRMGDGPSMVGWITDCVKFIQGSAMSSNSYNKLGKSYFMFLSYNMTIPSQTTEDCNFDSSVIMNRYGLYNPIKIDAFSVSLQNNSIEPQNNGVIVPGRPAVPQH